MIVDLEFLKTKKEVFVQEAEKLLSIQEKANQLDSEYLVRALVNEPDFIKGNLPFCLVQKCIKNTDDIFAHTHKDKEQNYRCDIKFSDDVIKMWQNMDRKYKKLKPERGDIILGHHVKHDSLVTHGFLSIITSVDQNLLMNTIEGCTINPYDEEPKHSQYNGLRRKQRVLNTKGKSRILGVFTPWFF